MGTAFSDMMKKLSPHPSEEAIIHQTLGASFLGKLRQHPDSDTLVNIYQAKGGMDDTTKQILEAVEAHWGPVSVAPVIERYGGDFAKLYHDWNMSPSELARVERTIGIAFFTELHGEHANMVEIYIEQGGTSEEAIKALEIGQESWEEHVKVEKVHDAIVKTQY